jgi:threonine/homoserine/homoserine lactone efflux protein
LTQAADILVMDPVTIIAFMGAGILLNLTPGADVLFASASGISGGWRAGIAAAFGITLGSLVHITLAAIGLAALITTTPLAYEAIRWLGAAYLAYLAVKTWRAAPDMVIGAGQGEGHLGRAIKRGFLTNVLNPKVALFVLAFLPQFTDPAKGPVWMQILFLGLIFTLTGLVINGAYGAAAGLFGGLLRRQIRLMNRITALVFGGLAARLLLN